MAKEVVSMDISLVSSVLLLHVISGIAFIAGLIGRAIALARAQRSEDIREVDTLVALAGPFERMVILGSAAVFPLGLLTMWAQDRPLFGDGSYWLVVSLVLFLSIIPFIPLVFLPRGRIFDAALEEARQRGEVTAELSAAFQDRGVAFARRYELTVVAVILGLMVVKPF